MTEATHAERYDHVDQLHRLTQFREWIDTNCLFPTVPDTIVRPMREYVSQAERIIVGELYSRNEIDKITAIRNVK